jgi:hypothetical protein
VSFADAERGTDPFPAFKIVCLTQCRPCFTPDLNGPDRVAMLLIFSCLLLNIAILEIEYRQ